MHSMLGVWAPNMDISKLSTIVYSEVHCVIGAKSFMLWSYETMKSLIMSCVKLIGLSDTKYYK